jgi:hypothetical protein
MVEHGLFNRLSGTKEQKSDKKIGSNANGPGPIFYPDGSIGYCALVRHTNEADAHWIVMEVRPPRRFP